MKLKENLKEEEVSQKFFLEMLANEGIKISKVAFWKWLSGETYPTVDKLLVIQKLTDDKVQAEDWVDGKV